MSPPHRPDLTTRLVKLGKLTEALGSLVGSPTARVGSGSALGFGALALKAAASLNKASADGSAMRDVLSKTLGKNLGRLQGGLAALDTHGRDGNTETKAPTPDGARFDAHSFADEAGHLGYKLYVPRAAGSKPLPLVVMLHGCTQSPDDFALGTRMNELAEEEGCYVAYPAQTRAANMQKCWNWFRAEDQGRGRGEPALIAGMVRTILREHNVDPSRVYVAGLSAGGAAAAVLGQVYPDLFAAVGVHSGLACGAAHDVSSAFSAMRNGASGTQTSGHFVPTIVFHGDRDATVSPVNGAQVITQAEGASGLRTASERGTSPGGVSFTRTVQADRNARPMLEHWVLHGGGHAWSGGSPDGSYTDPNGPDASAAILRFFHHHRLVDAEEAPRN